MEREPGTPLYQQLAAALRRQIISGALRVGGQLPTEPALADEYGMSRNTVRQAIGLLESEGLVRAIQGKGTFVSDPKSAPLPYRASLVHNRSQRASGTTAWRRDLRDFGREGEEIVTVERRPAPEDIAGLLGLEVGELVIVRRRVQLDGGKPTALADSWFPAALVEGTEIAEPAGILDGSDQAMARLGLEATHRHDTITARMPTPDESRALRIAKGVPVLLVAGTEFTGNQQPVEVFRRTLPADRHVVKYVVRKDA